MELIAQGAEAQILKINDNLLKKIRLEKPYRIKEIDLKLRKQRNKREFKVLTKLYENNIHVPKPEEITDYKTHNEISFTFEYINGKPLKYSLNKQLLNEAFQKIIQMHNLNVMHADLTTLNMIKQEKTNKVFLIDFGLSEFTSKFENKAVDLNLFFTCIKNEHKQYYKYKQELEETYSNQANNGEKIIQRLRNIEKRGRNK